MNDLKIGDTVKLISTVYCCSWCQEFMAKYKDCIFKISAPDCERNNNYCTIQLPNGKTKSWNKRNLKLVSRQLEFKFMEE